MRIAPILAAPLLIMALALPVYAGKTVATPAVKNAPANRGATTYKVQKGESLYLIARKTKVSVEDLLRLNNLPGPAIKPGQVLVLKDAPKKEARTESRPAVATAGKPQGETAKKSGAARAGHPVEGAGIKTHRVVKGESLYRIAQKAKVPVEELQRLNGLATPAIKPGQILVLRRSEAGAPRTAVAAPAAQPASPPEAAAAPQATHRVAKGENLYQIAKKTGVSVQELGRLNGLVGTRIKPGQVLLLGAASAAAQASTPREQGAETRAIPATEPPEGTPVTAASMPLPQTPFAGHEDSSFNRRFAQTVAELLATPYKFGGSSKKGIDCSGFVQRVFHDLDVSLPRSARDQYHVGTPVDREELQEGDLLFFRTYARFPSHVGIYLGDNKMVHASTRSRKVVITNINQSYYRSRYIGAKRINVFAPDLFDIEELKDVIEEERDEAFETSPKGTQKAS